VGDKELLKLGNGIVLPLYSTKNGVRFVPEKSGINQWNASGRQRKFGEAYIPIPAVIRNSFPDFLPPRDQKFRLRLPSGRVVVAKVCQQGGKALMSTPNVDICNWLFGLLDTSLDAAMRRFVTNEPYRYSDLQAVKIDSVIVYKSNNIDADFELREGFLGAFETFESQLH
jgi:hypothetical protein